MELKLMKEPVNVSETIFEGVAEHALECDVLLPDVNADVEKILRCEVTPALLSAGTNGERLQLDGIAVAQVYYVDAQGCLRRAEFKIPYTKTLELRGAAQTPLISVTQNVDYFNCRCVNSRRLDMRGAVSIQARVTSQTQEQVLCTAQGGGIQLRREPLENTVVLGGTRSLTVREELELGHGKAPVGAIVRCDASVRVLDYKAISNKLVTKGELSLHLLYSVQDDDQKLETMEYTLPVSQVIDIDGVDEGCSCSVWYDVISTDVQPQRNQNGEKCVFSVEASLNACARACRRLTLDAACDCYSTQYECRPETRQMTFTGLSRIVEEEIPLKQTLEIAGGFESVADLWCRVQSVTVRNEQENVVVSGKLSVRMFLRDSEGAYSYQEQSCDFTHPIAAEAAMDTVITPRLTVENAGYVISGSGKLEIRCSIRVQGELLRRVVRSVLCSLAVEQTKPKTHRDCQLYLYYANDNEPVWEIAKRYNTSVEAITSGNQIDGAAIQGKTMLIIPMEAV